ncbi:unnamed protein product [Trypanosoma congolense IL3000]|uniref:WGS project CAEQ00000000 data, annotated contig 1962 n=1 Tax=Trypanosoma congolense (strain IL3000) TaxID=1068625 RepID=F9WAE2_TRYCI|nr:unnamed protein product [Trypanosoma congolense IL3000]
MLTPGIITTTGDSGCHGPAYAGSCCRDEVQTRKRKCARSTTPRFTSPISKKATQTSWMSSAGGSTSCGAAATSSWHVAEDFCEDDGSGTPYSSSSLSPVVSNRDDAGYNSEELLEEQREFSQRRAKKYVSEVARNRDLHRSAMVSRLPKSPAVMQFYFGIAQRDATAKGDYCRSYSEALRMHQCVTEEEEGSMVGAEGSPSRGKGPRFLPNSALKFTGNDIDVVRTTALLLMEEQEKESRASGGLRA